MSQKSKRIGITTSMPIEVILAAGHIPVDLNNLFINRNSQELITKAEHEGFPRNVCSWIKGIYSVAREAQLDEVIGVTQGDCSNTHSMMSLLKDQGISVFSFAFPYDKDPEVLNRETIKLEEHFEVTRTETERTKYKLDEIRTKLLLLDEMTWKENKVTGLENHIWLVSASDFGGNPDKYEIDLDAFINEAKNRKPYHTKLRIAYLGVPPIFNNLYTTVSELGGEVIYNEIQRQFAMLSLKQNIIDQYTSYTYPYSVFDRIKDIEIECDKRQIGAIISYTQAFCHRQIDNILIKKYLNLPYLNLEGDQPGAVDSRTLLRLESFMEIYSG